MKILQVIPYFTPQRGGDVNVCYNMSKYLIEHNNEITIATTDFELDTNYVNTIPEISVVNFKCIRNIGLFLYSPDINIWAKENVKNFDVVHLHTFRSYQNNVICKYCREYDIPYILQAHGSMLPYSEKDLLKKAYDLVWGNKILNEAAEFIALTRIEANQYNSKGILENKIRIIPNGISMLGYETQLQKGDFKKKYGLSTGCRIILYVGRLHKSKGIELLLEAFADICTRMEDVILVIVGPNSGHKAVLEKFIGDLEIKDKVLFTGFIQDDEKKAAYMDADVFVTPKFSGFPITILEACAYGAPVVITKKGDEIDGIRGNIGGIVDYDFKQLSDAIYLILTDDELRDEIKEKQKELIIKNYQWNIIAKKLNNLYKEFE